MKKLFFAFVSILIVILIGSYLFIDSTHLKSGGTYQLSGLVQPVVVTEDSNGVPTLSGDSLLDLVRAQGWMEARDRLFQMDLIRRQSAGKLSEIFGPIALKSDQLHRLYGFKSVAERVMENLKPEAIATLTAFSEGVNAFMNRGPLPLEMRILGYKPAPWTPSDCFMVAVSMFSPPSSQHDLQIVAGTIPKQLLQFLTPQFGFLDAPIIPDTGMVPLPVAPKKELVNWREVRKASIEQELLPDFERESNGSNAWAISGSLTKSGKPILAGDPHLHLSLPNIWYRLKLKGPDFNVTGVNIPGLPGILIGSNGDVAWSLTNGMADAEDFVAFAQGADADHYLIDGKPTAFEKRNETIEVKGAKPVQETIRETIWGPVLEDQPGKEYALQAVALDPQNYARLDMTPLNLSKDLPSAFRALEEWAGPVHNAILATRDGHIGWTIIGNIPNRVGFDGSLPTKRDKKQYWKGYISKSEYPKVVDPANGILVSANQRYLPISQNPSRYSTDWAPPSRAFRIKGELQKRKDWTAEASYQLQLDVYSQIHIWYRDTLLKAISAEDKDPWLKAIFEVAKGWDGNISASSTGYVFMRKFRKALFQLFLAPVLSRISPVEDREPALTRLTHDEWMVALFKDKPMNMLPFPLTDYDSALREGAIRAAKALVDRPERLKTLQWGNSNRTKITHPLSAALPKWMADLINIPEVPLPGSSLVVREGDPSHAASFRMVVDLSDRSKGIFNQPGGQSGYPFSPNYKNQFGAWVAGFSQPFEPGEVVSSEILSPRG